MLTCSWKITGNLTIHFNLFLELSHFLSLLVVKYHVTKYHALTQTCNHQPFYKLLGTILNKTLYFAKLLQHLKDKFLKFLGHILYLLVKINGLKNFVHTVLTALKVGIVMVNHE